MTRAGLSTGSRSANPKINFEIALLVDQGRVPRHTTMRPSTPYE
ncbi:hypothetical protein ACFVWN_18745 [Nocardiopsis flavescens]